MPNGPVKRICNGRRQEASNQSYYENEIPQLNQRYNQFKNSFLGSYLLTFLGTWTGLTHFFPVLFGTWTGSLWQYFIRWMTTSRKK